MLAEESVVYVDSVRHYQILEWQRRGIVGDGTLGHPFIYVGRHILTFVVSWLGFPGHVYEAFGLMGSCGMI